jgi:hypothetical protein
MPARRMLPADGPGPDATAIGVVEHVERAPLWNTSVRDRSPIRSTAVTGSARWAADRAMPGHGDHLNAQRQERRPSPIPGRTEAWLGTSRTQCCSGGLTAVLGPAEPPSLASATGHRRPAHEQPIDLRRHRSFRSRNGADTAAAEMGDAQIVYARAAPGALCLIDVGPNERIAIEELNRLGIMRNDPERKEEVSRSELTVVTRGRARGASRTVRARTHSGRRPGPGTSAGQRRSSWTAARGCVKPRP